MLIAGLICCLASIIQHLNITYSLIALLLSLLIFYCIGVIAARIIGKIQAQHIAEERAKIKAQREAEESQKIEDGMTASVIQNDENMNAAQ